MANPVPSSRLATQLTCKLPTDLNPMGGPACTTFVGNCVYGSWNDTACACVCMGQGSPGGYCPDPSTGACTTTCA